MLNLRQKKILEILNDKKVARVNSLAEKLHYSSSTIRRDLSELGKENLVQRIPGGAILIDEVKNEAPQSFKENIHKKEKEYIGNLAINFIQEHNSIFLDGSSSSYFFAKLLCIFKNLTIITSNLRTALYLKENSSNTIFSLGGKVEDVFCNGTFTQKNALNFYVDLAVVSCRGITENGTSDHIEDETVLKQAMQKNARKTMVLADHFKFDQNFLYLGLDLSQIDIVVTDQKPRDEYISLFKANNITLAH
ncbi:DeoR/GlpR family DNA-binding transcription regulator [Lactobacillus sp. ESL0791]|uniref:DeoR/GlpR family DNA-binding transcription regulator n=1 Tax=Lactobacillus sp. ESL0791 TaxID=2983234 RepID=UPI0023F74DB0|nr:DeoR/GlpR family DNA-binding transcription regulator [Lactobacillus sp. ESL0791]MDF7638081.1 DeoR/GlpR family DNA-binding transcription regulator [Lactobacillus sp. ESL0791]